MTGNSVTIPERYHAVCAQQPWLHNSSETVSGKAGAVRILVGTSGRPEYTLLEEIMSTDTMIHDERLVREPNDAPAETYM